MHSTSVYDPQLLVLEGAEKKALATDHRVDVFCDLLLNRHTATWDVFVLVHNEKPFFLFQNIST